MVYLFGTNLDIKDAKDESKSPRFLASSRGLKKFANKKNKIVIMSHRGRPDGREKSLSLRHFAALFEKTLRKRVQFLDNENLSKARQIVKTAKPGSIFILENTRFLKGESENDPALARELASLGNVYINDDFATAHRENASNVGITRWIPSKMGPNLQHEVAHLSKAIYKPRSPFVLVLGGAKMADKMGVIDNLIGKLDYILVGGGVANTFLKSQGYDIGNSLFEEEMIGTAKKLLKGRHGRKIVMPVDYAKDEKGRLLDIGPKTAKLYRGIILKAKTIIWGGPMGYFEDPRFAKGSEAIARAIAASKGLSIVGGGETAEVVTGLGLSSKISLVSTGGGAMLDFLAGKKMPAIDALRAKSEARNPKP